MVVASHGSAGGAFLVTIAALTKGGPHAVRRATVPALCSAECQPRDKSLKTQCPGVAVVEQQLQALSQGNAGLREGLALMADEFRQQPDAMEQFAALFASPRFEGILGCASWEYKGTVSLRDVPQYTPLPEGRAVLAYLTVELMVRVAVTPGRPKWAEAHCKAPSGVGHQLPVSTYVWTVSCSLEEPCRWRVEGIDPEDPLRAPSNLADLYGDVPKIGHLIYP